MTYHTTIIFPSEEHYRRLKLLALLENKTVGNVLHEIADRYREREGSNEGQKEEMQ